jgi:hypothetical protein
LPLNIGQKINFWYILATLKQKLATLKRVATRSLRTADIKYVFLYYFSGLQLRLLAPDHIAHYLKEALPSKWFSMPQKKTVSWYK